MSSSSSSLSSPTSRLDRLFILLSASSTASTRSLAAKQLGGLVRLHPGELPTLLARIHPLLHSAGWNVRTAAAEAIEAIVRELPRRPKEVKEEEGETKCELPEAADRPVTRTRMTFGCFDLERVLKDAEELENEDDEDDDDDDDASSSSVEHQRQALNKTLGLDVSAKLGIRTDDIFSTEDLDEMSFRRTKRIRRKNQNASSSSSSAAAAKRSRMEREKRLMYGGGHDSPRPLQEFCDCLVRDLSDKKWEVRHGAATAIREVVRGILPEVDDEFVGSAILEDIGFHLLCVMSRDKFSDFLSDQVVAPVRETAAQALGSVLALMSAEKVCSSSQSSIGVVSILREMATKDGNWQCRHGGMLGIKYLLAVRPDLAGSHFLRDLYPSILQGIRDQESDDVVMVAASALVPVVAHVPDVENLSEMLWETLRSLDDLTSSTHSVMQLLSEIVQQQQKCSGNIGLFSRLSERIPLILPFLSHSSSMVRKAALSTLDALTRDSQISSEFLPLLVKDLMFLLFQRSLLEHHENILILVERVWGYCCDFTPLGPLLMSTCPLYGPWVSSISQPPGWPLQLPQREGVVSADAVDKHFLGGPAAQSETDAVEKDRLVWRARHRAARMLGKLAGFIVQPVPGLDYSQDSLPPMEMFATKILLPNLTTQSAYRLATVSLVVSEWCEQHCDVSSGAPDNLKLYLSRFLADSSPACYDEVAMALAALRTDVADFVATLKHYKMSLPADSNGIFSPEEIQRFLTTTDFKAVMSSNAKVKAKTSQSLLGRVDECLLPAMTQVMGEHVRLSLMASSCVAGACIGLKAITDKLNPVIKPLMESIKKEQNLLLQALAAKNLARMLEICCDRVVTAPVEKVLRNLVSFASSSSDSSTAAEATKADDDVQTRGAKLALEAVMKHFHDRVFDRLPLVHHLTVGAVLEVGTEAEKPTADLTFCLRALEIIVPNLAPSLQHCLSSSLPNLVSLLKRGGADPNIRRMSSRCLAQISRFQPLSVMTAVIYEVIPMLESPHQSHRHGAIECITMIVDRADEISLLPYVAFFVVPVLGRMSDDDVEVRTAATSAFATLINLAPLEGAVKDPVDLPKDLAERKSEEKKFLEQLTNVKNLEDYRLNVAVEAELRRYQVEGINWLAFLNRYQLHGILCDDMGLGKTLQTICMVASHHRQKEQGVRPDKDLLSLVICPATLCRHWSSETIRFVGDSVLRPLVYVGNVGARADLRKTSFSQSNFIITSYDVVRSDVEFLSPFNWDYVILDEGQTIKNGRTKTTMAIKRLKSRHRLILSGTPIQNSVLDLWSLFDFLMPGFLGSERQFTAKFGRPISASREPKCSQRDQEAGALAMEALHRQVLPFILRRLKEDVLSDLPPKITQDFYCDLSPLQERLYEDFAKKQTKVNGQEQQQQQQHVFQALQYLRKVCNHPKLVLNANHREFGPVMESLRRTNSSLDEISHSGKLPALRDLLLQCGIGSSGGDADDDACLAGQHRALVFFQMKAMMDIVAEDLLRKTMPSVTYLRLDGSVPAGERQGVVDRFNGDVSIDVLLISTAVGGLGLNLTGADTVIFVEHDWNPMKDLQAMDRAHRIGQKKVVNVYRLISRNTIEEKIMGLQKFKIRTANTVISADNSSLQSMATDQLFDLFSLEDNNRPAGSAEEASSGTGSASGGRGGAKKSIRALLEEMPELWDIEQYDREYDLNTFVSKNKTDS